MANLELGEPIGNVRLTDAGRASCRTRRQRLPHSRMGGEAVHGLQVGARRHAQNLKTLALRILGPAPARGHELVQAGAPETFQMVVCTENSVRVDYTNLRSRPSTMISACAGRSHRG